MLKVAHFLHDPVAIFLIYFFLTRMVESIWELFTAPPAVQNFPPIGNIFATARGDLLSTSHGLVFVATGVSLYRAVEV